MAALERWEALARLTRSADASSCSSPLNQLSLLAAGCVRLIDQPAPAGTAR